MYKFSNEIITKNGHCKGNKKQVAGIWFLIILDENYRMSIQ